jgi:putative ABC transport system permease protein
MAIGALPGSVVRMVMRQGIVLVAIGAAVGLGLTVAVSGALRGAFPSAQGVNLGVYALIVPALLAVTLLAAFLPALRAARIDPLAALRQD